MMLFNYMTYMATPSHKNPCPKGHEIYNFCRTFEFVIITIDSVSLIYAQEWRRYYPSVLLLLLLYILILSDLCLSVQKRILKEKDQFYTFYTQIISIWFVNHEIYNFSSFTLKMLLTKFGKDWPGSS